MTIQRLCTYPCLSVKKIKNKKKLAGEKHKRKKEKSPKNEQKVLPLEIAHPQFREGGP